jgi:hypothetical protein
LLGGVQQAQRDLAGDARAMAARMDRALNQFVSGTVRGQNLDFKYGKGVENVLLKGLGHGALTTFLIDSHS